MTLRFVRASLLVGTLAAAMATPSAAQLADNLGALTGDNAKGYLRPLPKALSATLNSSLFQSASIPLAGVNVSLGVAASVVVFDDGDRTYHPTDPPGFVGLAPVEAPTVIGDGVAVPQAGQGGATLYHPGGLDLRQFTVAVPQLTVGSAFGTRAVVRWISVDLGDSDLGKLTLFGIGAQHSISRYLPKLPVNLAAGLMYQTLTLGDDKLIDTKGLHFDITASRRFNLLEPYASLGYDTFSMKAKYESKTASPGEKITVDFDRENSAHLALGLQFRLPFVRLHGEFIAAAQTGAALGLDFGN
jgi:hypothetical protein